MRSGIAVGVWRPQVATWLGVTRDNVKVFLFEGKGVEYYLIEK